MNTLRRYPRMLWGQAGLGGCTKKGRDTNEPRWRQGPAEGLGLTALFSNTPPGTRRGPLFRFTQTGSTILSAETQRCRFFSPHRQSWRQFFAATL